MSSAGSARSFYCHGGTARGPRLAAGAVGELGSVRSPGCCRPEETRVPERIRSTRFVQLVPR
jgi:hypothetical protein